MLVRDVSAAGAWLLDDERDLRTGATLATLDRALLQAAVAEHVPVIED